jgi:protein-S-isoprenylcysteine O-methyltransferase Ste14
MTELRVGIGIAWAIFWIGWLAVGFTAKSSTGRRNFLGGRGLAAVAVVILLRGLRGSGLEVHSLVLGIIGTGLFVAGIALAIWARVILGRNWGMPMTQRAEPELVTAGPYGLIRHPIYTGILLGLVGTALVTSLIGLGIALILGIYFVHAARVEEGNLTETFPTAYPPYKARTKMLIPFLL